jgi:hypothetical protein
MTMRHAYDIYATTATPHGDAAQRRAAHKAMMHVVMMMRCDLRRALFCYTQTTHKVTTYSDDLRATICQTTHYKHLFASDDAA